MMQDFSSSFITPKEDPVGTKYESKFQMDIKKYLTWLILGVVGIAVGSFIYSWVARPMTITVTGVGEAVAPVTSVAYSFNISQTDSEPGLAIATVKSRAEALRALLKGYATVDSDIIESQVTVVPSNLITAGTSGYQATITMAAKLGSGTDSSQIVSQLYSSGASLVSQPVITADNLEELEQEAYEKALEDAKSKAGGIALKHLKFIRKVSSVVFANTSSATSVSSKESTVETTLPTNVIKINKAATVTYSLW